MAKKSGRKTGYKDSFNIQVEKLCKLGATDKEIADFFEVVESTINLWKLNHKGFSESIKKGKIIADAEVANKLFHRATGYEHPEEKIFQYEGDVIRADTIKHYPPDTAAAFIWLKNRRKNSDAPWVDKQDITHTIKDYSKASKKLRDLL